MKNPSRPVITLLTHGLALAAGWAIYQGVDSRHAEDAGPNESSAATKASNRSSAAEKSGREILAGVMKKVADTPGAGVSRGPSDPQQAESIRARIDSIEVPEDFAVAFNELLAVMQDQTRRNEENHIDSIALAYHWLSQDPQAYFDWLAADPKRRIIGNTVMMSSVSEIYRRSGADALLPMIEMSGSYRSFLSAGIASSMASAADSSGVLKARELITGQAWTQFVRNLGTGWPDDQLDSLIKLAVACDDPMIALGHNMNSPGHGSYIAGLLADESLPEDFRQQISQNEMARQSLARDVNLPLEMRLENGADRNQIVRNDVLHLLTAERDWAHAFRTGEATAQEVLDTISAGTPDLAKAEPDAIREQVFRNLAEENPTRAMELLENLPEAERDQLALFTSRSHFDSVEPHKFLELLEQVPADTPEQWEGRLDAWNRRGFTNHERLQDGYVEWIQQLPPGIDREMGLYSLARAVDAGNPELAIELRGQVTDPELQKRISQHR